MISLDKCADKRQGQFRFISQYTGGMMRRQRVGVDRFDIDDLEKWLIKLFRGAKRKDGTLAYLHSVRVAYNILTLKTVLEEQYQVFNLITDEDIIAGGLHDIFEDVPLINSDGSWRPRSEFDWQLLDALRIEVLNRYGKGVEAKIWAVTHDLHAKTTTERRLSILDKAPDWSVHNIVIEMSDQTDNWRGRELLSPGRLEYVQTLLTEAIPARLFELGLVNALYYIMIETFDLDDLSAVGHQAPKEQSKAT